MDITELIKKINNNEINLREILNNGYGYKIANYYYEKKDYNEALIWFLREADNENPDAKNKIGYLYFMGQGVIKDDKKALEWYKKAAKHEHCCANYNIGLFYENGLGGLDKNTKKANEYYKKSKNCENNKIILNKVDNEINNKNSINKKVEIQILYFLSIIIVFFIILLFKNINEIYLTFFLIIYSIFVINLSIVFLIYFPKNISKTLKYIIFIIFIIFIFYIFRNNEISNSFFYINEDNIFSYLAKYIFKYFIIIIPIEIIKSKCEEYYRNYIDLFIKTFSTIISCLIFLDNKIYIIMLFFMVPILNQMYIRLNNTREGIYPIYIISSGITADSTHWRVQIDGIGSYEIFKKDGSIKAIPIEQKHEREIKKLKFHQKLYFPYIQYGYIGKTNLKKDEIDKIYKKTFNSFENQYSSSYKSCQEFCTLFLNKMGLKFQVTDLKLTLLSIFLFIILYKIKNGRIEIII